LEHDNPARAAKFLAVAVKMPHAPARAWFNLGIAYQRSGRPADALAAFEHAAQMPDADADMQKAAEGIKEIYQSTPTNLPAK
jgi:Tfp pilus assembly protein PilF